MTLQLNDPMVRYGTQVFVGVEVEEEPWRRELGKRLGFSDADLDRLTRSIPLRNKRFLPALSYASEVRW